MTSLKDRAAGSAHGRFQPLHKGHLEYLLAAKEQCRFLWVGITQIDVLSLHESPLDRHREVPENNPLTYFERLELITEALKDEGVNPSEFGVIPFPIDNTRSLPNFLPLHVPIFTTICEKWNVHKINILKSIGYEVIVLWERAKKVYEGIQIRKDILAGGSDWLDSVPPATIRAVERYALGNRLRQLQDSSLAMDELP